MHQIKGLTHSVVLALTTMTLSACNLLSTTDTQNSSQVKVIEAQPVANNVSTSTKSTINAQNSAKAYAMLSIKDSNTNVSQSDASNTPSISNSIANLKQDKLQDLIALNQDEDQKQIELLTTDTDNATRPQGVGETLPNYASDSNLANLNCDISLQTKAQSIAYELTANLIERYNGAKEHVYVASTIINSKASDCLSDVKNEITQALVQKPRLTVINDNKIADSYAAASQSSIPNLIAQCRKNNIPYLVISNIKDRGNNISLNIRFIRVNDGITLFQNSKNIK